MTSRNEIQGGAVEQESRRDTIIAATLRLLRAGGPRAVTHRAVAEEGGVPLAATTYYFSSKEELMEEALRRIAGEEVDRLSARSRQLIAAGAGNDLTADGLADLLAEALRGEEEGELPKFEIYLEAARRPALRSACAHWLDAFCELAEAALQIAGTADPAGASRVLVAGIDGMFVHKLARGERPYPDSAMRGDLGRLVRGLLASA